MHMNTRTPPPPPPHTHTHTHTHAHTHTHSDAHIGSAFKKCLSSVYSDALIVEKDSSISATSLVKEIIFLTLLWKLLPYRFCPVHVLIAFLTTREQIGFHYTHPILAESKMCIVKTNVQQPHDHSLLAENKCVIMRLLYSRSLPQEAASFIFQH